MNAIDYNSINNELKKLWIFGGPSLTSWNKKALSWLLENYGQQQSPGMGVQATRLLYGSPGVHKHGRHEVGDYEVAIGQFLAIAPGVVFLDTLRYKNYEKYSGLVRVSTAGGSHFTVSIVLEPKATMHILLPRTNLVDDGCGEIVISRDHWYDNDRSILTVGPQRWLELSLWLTKWLSLPQDSTVAPIEPTRSSAP